MAVIPKKLKRYTIFDKTKKKPPLLPSILERQITVDLSWFSWKTDFKRKIFISISTSSNANYSVNECQILIEQPISPFRYQYFSLYGKLTWSQLKFLQWNAFNSKVKNFNLNEDWFSHCYTQLVVYGTKWHLRQISTYIPPLPLVVYVIWWWELNLSWN